MSRPLKILLTISLLMNLLLIGVIAGHAGRFLIDHSPRRGMQEIAASLPPEKRAAFEESMKQAEEDSAELHEQLDEARTKAAAVLTAPDFDKEAYLVEVSRINALRGQFMQRMAESIAQFASQCTPEERAMLAEKLRRPREMRRRLDK